MQVLLKESAVKIRCLALRDGRSIRSVSREAIRLWINRFGQHFAQCVRRDRPQPNDKWHFAEQIARRKRAEVPHECFRDRGLMSKWIGANA